MIKRALWRILYLFMGHPKNVVPYMAMLDRTRRPVKFKPHMWHNTYGNQWHIHFEDDGGVTHTGTIPAHIEVSRDTGRIVGLTIYDETLRGSNG